MLGFPVKKLDKIRNAKNRGGFAAGHLCGTGRATRSGHEAPNQGGGGQLILGSLRSPPRPRDTPY